MSYTKIPEREREIHYESMVRAYRCASSGFRPMENNPNSLRWFRAIPNQLQPLLLGRLKQPDHRLYGFRQVPTHDKMPLDAPD